MIIPARSASWAVSGEYGVFTWIVTVSGPDTETESIGEISLARNEPFSARWRSSDSLTASAFSGVPSLNLIPDRILIVYVSLSFEITGSADASCGTIWSFELRSYSFSHMCRNTMRPTNVRASVGSSASGSSARPMTSVPPFFGCGVASLPAPAAEAPRTARQASDPSTKPTRATRRCMLPPGVERCGCCGCGGYSRLDPTSRQMDPIRVGSPLDGSSASYPFDHRSTPGRRSCPGRPPRGDHSLAGARGRDPHRLVAAPGEPRRPVRRQPHARPRGPPQAPG